MPSDLEIRRLENPEAAAEAALELVLQAAVNAVEQRGRFVLALSGGSTPRKLYELLAQQDIDWAHWHLIYGDERCLPDGDTERTSTLVEQSWLNLVSFPRDNHHIPPVTLGAQAAAFQYSDTIANLLPIDVALQGMGEDGHTASLFPGQRHPDSLVVPIYDSPKPPPERISLGYQVLCNAYTVCFLVTGAGKRPTLERWLAGEELPVARIHGQETTVLITDALS